MFFRERLIELCVPYCERRPSTAESLKASDNAGKRRPLASDSLEEIHQLRKIASTRMSVNFDIWDDFADLSTIVQNDLNITYKIKKRENAQVVNNRYIIG